MGDPLMVDMIQLTNYSHAACAETTLSAREVPLVQQAVPGLVF